MPLGPRVVLTRSAIAIAPTKDCCGKVKNLGKRIRTYQSCNFTFVFGSALVENLGKDVLESVKRWDKLTPTISISVDAIVC
jgi:hypothetical protein